MTNKKSNCNDNGKNNSNCNGKYRDSSPSASLRVRMTTGNNAMAMGNNVMAAGNSAMATM